VPTASASPISSSALSSTSSPDWATGVTVIDMDSREGRDQVVEYYDNATEFAIGIEDPTWATMLTKQITEELDATKDTKYKNRLRKIADKLTGT
jgi:hypothetical protein